MELTHACRVTVRFQVPGFHRWPDAPGHCAYLSNDHRHLFHVEVSTPVEHHEREIEFHDLMEAKGLFCQPTNWANCETKAYHLATRLSERHQGAPFTVSVYEDGEAGATVELS